MRTQQRQWLTDILEGLPSVAFILAWRQSGDLQLAGWTGTGVAVLVFVCFRVFRLKVHPVLLGVNVHILLATPLIYGAYRLGFEDAGAVMADYSYAGVLVTVFLTGLCLSVFSKGGFAGCPDLPKKQRRLYSLAMLVVALLGAAWALATPADSLLPVVLTLTVVVGGRRFLLARHADKSTAAGSGTVAVLTGGSTQGPEAQA